MHVLNVPASALHSIGPDAVTVRGSAVKERLPELDKLPRMSDVIGHKMVTRSGRLLGSIDDMLIDGTDGTIIGFAVGEGVVATNLRTFSTHNALEFTVMCALTPIFT